MTIPLNIEGKYKRSIKFNGVCSNTFDLFVNDAIRYLLSQRITTAVINILANANGINFFHPKSIN